MFRPNIKHTKNLLRFIRASIWIQALDYLACVYVQYYNFGWNYEFVLQCTKLFLAGFIPTIIAELWVRKRIRKFNRNSEDNGYSN